MQLSKLTGAMGAEITGLRLSDVVPDETADALRKALAEHHMIVLRGLHIDLPTQKALTRVFGPPMQLPYVEPTAEDPEVIAVLKEASERGTGVFGGDWHSDFSFLENPPAGSILSAHDIPAVGGDTLWANQALAYETLSPDLKVIVDTCDAVHIGAPYGVRHAPAEEERANGSIRMTRGDPQADKERLHPAVLTHPTTGQRALFLNPIYTTRFDNMTEFESQPLLAEIYKHATRPDFCCRLKWQAGDVAIWDNRMTLHYATNDYDGQRRLLYRTTWSGEVPA